MIAGCDFSTRFIDIVLLEENTDAATWHRYELSGQDAFDRARSVRAAMPHGLFWDQVMAVGIEAPFGPNRNTLLRVQGAILACIPGHKLVCPLPPSQWRSLVGLPGNASKEDVATTAVWRLGNAGVPTTRWTQDALDAYLIAVATRGLVQHGKEAA